MAAAFVAVNLYFESVKNPDRQTLQPGGIGKNVFCCDAGHNCAHNDLQSSDQD